jgi:hypothetical protein
VAHSVARDISNGLPNNVTIITDIVKQVIPNIPTTEIQTFNELKAVQELVLPKIADISERYYRHQVKVAGADLLTLRELKQVNVPSDVSTLAVAVPKFLGSREVIDRANEILASKGRPALNLRRSEDVRALRFAYETLARKEVAVFEPYVVRQEQLNRDIARSN